MTRRRVVPGFLVLIAAALPAAPRSGMAAQRQPAPMVISSLSGADLFRFYCASCHGLDGKGDGPVAPSLREVPADLTRIAARRGGHFPAEELRRFIAGDDRPLAAHGSREMPVWGPIFRSLEPHDRLTDIRLENIVAYLETLQKPE